MVLIALVLYDPVATFSGTSFMTFCGLENVFNVPTTARVIWRWGHSLVSYNASAIREE